MTKPSEILTLCLDVNACRAISCEKKRAQSSTALRHGVSPDSLIGDQRARCTGTSGGRAASPRPVQRGPKGRARGAQRPRSCGAIQERRQAGRQARARSPSQRGASSSEASWTINRDILRCGHLTRAADGPFSRCEKVSTDSAPPGGKRWCHPRLLWYIPAVCHVRASYVERSSPHRARGGAPCPRTSPISPRS